jgi:hypothetical protein
MKKIFITIIASSMIGIVFAQVPTQDPYPNIPIVAVNVNQYNFYIDSVSNLNEQQRPFGSVNNNTNPPTALSLAGISSGVHQLYAKVTDVNGKPSILAIGNFYMEGDNLYQNAPPAANNMDKYSFYIDSVSTINEQSQTFLATNNNTAAPSAISLTGVNSGVHQLYAKVTDFTGKPSIINVGNFYMNGDNLYQNAPSAATNINRYSFYIDSVSSVNEQPFSFSVTNNNTSPPPPISLAGVASGVHQLYTKVTDINGIPSITNIGNFYMGGDNLYQNAPTPAVNINRYEFYVDSVTNVNIQPLSFATGLNNVTPTTNIDLTGVIPGVHNLYARVFDVNNIPSIVNLGSFSMDQNFKYQNAPAAAPTVANMEYYVDTDPGYGLGSPIALAANTNVVITNLPVTIPTTLGLGMHIFHIRSKQNPWSIDEAISFNVGGVVPNTWSFITAKLQAAQTLVTWGTEQEVNSLKFDVERSVNGIQFIKIGEQQAAGNSSSLKTYNFIDTKPETGFNYYRIKQIDVDGSVHYSTIVKVLHTKNIKEAFIAPNPVVDVINLVEPIATNINTLEVYDSKGTLVLRKVVNSSVQLYSLPVTNLPTGKYVLKINYDKSTKSIVFVK